MLESENVLGESGNVGGDGERGVRGGGGRGGGEGGGSVIIY